jgi:predicted nucleotide-binding protein
VGLDPVVLHREADQGRTLIEKFEHHSDVCYALVLLTPDDVGCTVAEVQKPESERNFEFRARQNVIFEFGYFAGRLSRKNVCCVYKAGVILPSDLSGFIYKEVRNSIEEVGYALIREFRSAGLEVDMKQ